MRYIQPNPSMIFDRGTDARTWAFGRYLQELTKIENMIREVILPYLDRQIAVAEKKSDSLLAQPRPTT